MSIESVPNVNQTAKKLIQKAQLLLQERGYQFFSFQDLADSVGIRKASVHHYFKTKDELARMMIVDYQQRLQLWIANIDAKAANPRHKLHAYFELFSDISRAGKSVCPGGSLLLDWNNFSKAVRVELQKLVDLHRLWVIGVLEDNIKNKGSRIQKEHVAAHALMIGASIQGALQIARASEEPAKVLNSIFKHIDRATFVEGAYDKK